jgi:hypothetical protein
VEKTVKKTSLVCLCAFVTLFAACGGSEQTAEDTTEDVKRGPEKDSAPEMAEPESASATNDLPLYASTEELKKFLTDKYTEEELKQLYIDITAATLTDEARLKELERDRDVSDETLREQERNLRHHLNDAIKSAGINSQLYGALMLMASDNGWKEDEAVQAAVEARAGEIDAARQ